MNDINVLVVGGGKIATDKIKRLLNFTTNIKIVSPEICDDLFDVVKQYNLKYDLRKYFSSDLENIFMVVVAVDDITLQKEIFDQAKQTNCLCNSVDSTKYCNFIFPAYIKKDDLLISISTSGSSPAFARHFKRFLTKIIPDDIGEFLAKMKNYRKTLPKGKKRMEFLDKEVHNYIQSWEK